MTKTITLSDKQYDALAIIHNHLADEEQSYEHASAEDKEYHIWQYVLQLRELLQNPGKAEVTAIANIQGGVLQDVYCPNPDITFDYMLIDYDNEEAGIDGYEELVRSLECADEEESKYGYQPSVRETLDEKRATLAELRQEHRDLDLAIAAMLGDASVDTIRVQRLKKRKLALKDRIAALEDRFLPDIIA